MRGFLITLLFLLVLAVAADRIALIAAEQAVASQLQSGGGLSSRPHVSIRGVPFLTQALTGTFDDVEVTASEVTVGRDRLSSFQASLRGLHLPLSDALSNSVTRVPVDRVTSHVVLSYPELQSRLRSRDLTLSPAGPLLRVTGSLTILGKTLSASALSSVRLSGGNVRVTAQRFEVGSVRANALITAALGRRLDFTARIGALPYGLKLTGVQVRPEGIAATATATHAILTR